MDLIKQLIIELENHDAINDKLEIIKQYFDLAKKLSNSSEKKRCCIEIAALKNQYLEKFNESKTNTIDVSIPSIQNSGSIHILTMVIDELRRIMYGFGFIEVFGPCIDDIEHNFTALNVSETHPAAGMHDTFYLQSNKLLRSHTSNVQIRIFESEKYKGECALFSIGRAYRKDDDPTHSPIFHQMEWISISSKITIGHLKYWIRLFIETFFGIKNLVLRFRPNYFPFTSPSIEVDILSMIDANGNLSFCTEFSKDGKWLEILGSGLIAKNVLKRYKYEITTGFAIGLGVERLAMLKYGISDISDFYKNKYPFIRNSNIRVADFRQNEKN